MPSRPSIQSSWLPWFYALLLIPLVLLCIETIRGALHETQMLARQTLSAELQQLRWQAERRAEGLGVLRAVVGPNDDENSPWVEEPLVSRYWSQVKPAAAHYLYAAVVDPDGDILLHTSGAQRGARLERGWYDRRIPEFSALTWSAASPLAGQRAAYDASIPIKMGSDDDGTRLHVGLDAAWLDDQVASRQRAAAWHWGGMLLLVGAVGAAAVGALVGVARQGKQLQQLLLGQARRRARELAQLGSGLAHEIRNPLHALRINLHTLRRAMGGKSALPPEQLTATLDESEGAISRLDGLMHDLLMFADPAQGQVSQVDLVEEVQATLRLLSEDLRRDQIAVREALPVEPAPVAIDAARLRQSLLNLLTFAQHRSGKTGMIEVAIERSDGGVELWVGDSGPAVSADKQVRMFEPFQATAETGSGLGLALVQSYVEEAGGKVSCHGDSRVNNRCGLWLPLAPAEKGGTL